MKFTQKLNPPKKKNKPRQKKFLISFFHLILSRNIFFLFPYKLCARKSTGGGYVWISFTVSLYKHTYDCHNLKKLCHNTNLLTPVPSNENEKKNNNKYIKKTPLFSVLLLKHHITSQSSRE